MKKTTDLKVNKTDEIHIEGSEPVGKLANLNTNPNIPTHHADMIGCLFGTDGSTLISFFARTPGLNVEECRISFSQELAKRIVDIFSSHLNYYPQKSLPAEVKKKDLPKK